jgi:hypothetical protein
MVVELGIMFCLICLPRCTTGAVLQKGNQMVKFYGNKILGALRVQYVNTVSCSVAKNCVVRT